MFGPTRPDETNKEKEVEPTKDELQAAIERHVQRSAEFVARCPISERTILHRDEVEAWERDREQRNQNS